MSKKAMFTVVFLMLTVSLSGCLRDKQECSIDYELGPYEALKYEVNRYDGDDPELFMAHGTDDRNPSTAYSEATELQGIYDDLQIHNTLVPSEGADHGAWCSTVNEKCLLDLTYDFLMDRQSIDI